MAQESITAELFAVLDIVVTEQLDDGYFDVIGVVPDWFKHFYPNVNFKLDRLKLGEKFPFLENFLVDAENFWQENGLSRLKSGIWNETDTFGKNCQLEATAIKLKNRKILLIECLGDGYQKTQYVLQKARENILNYHRLIKEIQKKEILMHCIIHDLGGQLSTIDYCFQLLELQDLAPKGKEYVEIGKQQSRKHRLLIREILDAFSAEAEALNTFELEPLTAPDLFACAQEVVNTLLPAFLSNQVNLQLNPDINLNRDWKVVGEKSRLERMLVNLLENALRHSPPNSNAIVDIRDDEKFIVVTVDDEGAGVPADIADTLFQKFTQGKNKPGRSGLGLYFCRITVEGWGGQIGYLNRAEGGARFWFRLPRLV